VEKVKEPSHNATFIDGLLISYVISPQFKILKLSMLLKLILEFISILIIVKMHTKTK
jgi:hypothetical protein